MGVAERINSKDGSYGANVTSVGVVADAENVPSSMISLILLSSSVLPLSVLFLKPSCWCLW